jgi:hypothetical protein
VKPQNLTILGHLTDYDSITPMQAMTVYGIYRLAAAIHDLRKDGFEIASETKFDAVGHKYTKYSLVINQSKEELAA